RAARGQQRRWRVVRRGRRHGLRRRRRLAASDPRDRHRGDLRGRRLSRARVRRAPPRGSPDRVARPRRAGRAYPWFVHAPIRLTRSLRWTFEHGHANNSANESASVAYWSQTEPHAPFPALPARDALRPPLPAAHDEVREAYLGAVGHALASASTSRLYQLAAIGELYYAGRFDDALRKLREG